MVKWVQGKKDVRNFPGAEEGTRRGRDVGKAKNMHP